MRVRFSYRLRKYWKVAEWLKAADCKSALFGVRGFESLPSNKMVRSSNGEDTALSRQRCEFDSRTDYKNNAGERVEARSVKPLLVGSIPTNGTKTKDADIAQLVRAGRLYRQGCGFKSRYRYKTRMSYNGITGHFQCSDEGSIPFIRSKRLMFQSTRNDEG